MEGLEEKYFRTDVKWHFFRSREESRSCMKTEQQFSLNLRCWPSTAESPRAQQPRGGRGQANSGHSPQEEDPRRHTQGSSNYGDKDIVELDSPLFIRRDIFWV